MAAQTDGLRRLPLDALTLTLSRLGARDIAAV
eukprot:CAMPEP_0119263346 /NCGR_PEP_ID=MMETSP1329-20130426/2778_1 /TAXON_ID=114041 /ORGANISM="Genus nov. species nov., Strain RCC1024" /LENGTH=31 /DNA_ID= /DNA_START= /DNA_END= /DNA_ORIENTATION=